MHDRLVPFAACLLVAALALSFAGAAPAAAMVLEDGPGGPPAAGIDAPIDVVFQAISDIEGLPDNDPDILTIEFLTAQRTGRGTRFRETRRMKNQEMITELEVTEYVPNERVRLVADEGGTIWDTTFTTRPVGDGAVELKLVMDANAYELTAKLMVPMIQGAIQKVIEKDLDAVKAHCESASG